ncbi:NAD(P)/FAD-dependent oxidoreductase [Xylanibacter ruminicola]|uniref:Geranylgeranyl reductase family n=1 Tax=Xylanibacter ruminicola TaxID=839 RepID=A0A1M6VUG5_XYLRU|nr:FAD-dependent monooxygenase [Xylanibacter ruminicola]SHK85090.1 geranylgeranyl reductase family [Xylanibacter ruminicola]
MKTVDVVIIGAGPAGSVCGYLLQKAGKDCLLIDHASFPRDKICGGGLTPKAWQLLDQIYPGLEYAYNPITRVRTFIDDEFRCEFSINSPKRYIRIVKRRDFDHLLLQRYVGEGGAFLKGSFARFDEVGGDYPVVVTLRSGQQIACKYLVGADGATSRVRQQIAPDSPHGMLSFEQYQSRSEAAGDTITIAMSRDYVHGYFYHFPNQKEDVVGFCDLVATKQKTSDVCATIGYPLHDHERLHGAYIPRNSVVSPFKRVMLVGDAGGFPNRVSYEGLYYAFATGKNAAEAIISGRDFRQVNRVMYRKKRKEDFLDRVVYSGGGLAVLKALMHFPRVVQYLFNVFV